MSLSIGIVGPPQRWQVFAFHRPYQENRVRRELSVCHHRAQYGHGSVPDYRLDELTENRTIRLKSCRQRSESVDIAGPWLLF